MKKVALLIVAVAFAVSASSKKAFTFGPKVGINVADLHAEGEKLDMASGAKPALVVGAFAEYRAAPWFAVSLDLLYSRQGSAEESSTGIVGGEMQTTKFNYRMNYLNIPVMANFYVLEGLALKVGIQPGFLMSAKYRVKPDGGSWSTTDIKDGFKSADFSVPVGISYTFNNGLLIDARYNIPVTDVAADKTKEAVAAEGGKLDKITNRVFALTVGWKF